MTEERATDEQGKDWADLHVERWRGHWMLGTPFDDDTEAIFIRMGRLVRHLRATMERAARQVGLEQFEYETLHHLMVRETPGAASPTQLAEDLGISPAGMTGRLATLEKAGWLRRTTIPDDRRRVMVEITSEGADVWRAAMALRGQVEDELSSTLTRAERGTMADLLRRMTLHLESAPDADPSTAD